MSKNYIITIGREYGSGGHEIGKKVAEILGIKFYDKELINKTAEDQGLSKKVLEEMDEKKGSVLKDPTVNLFHSSMSTNLPAFGPFGKSINDRVFMAESSEIHKLADEESCVIIGRCANTLLRNRDNVLNVFIQAPKEDRIQRIMTYTGEKEEEAKKEMYHVDKTRRSYYEYYTDERWGHRDNYNLIIDSSILGIDGTAEEIANIIRKKYMK